MINIKYPLEDNKNKNTLFKMNNVTKEALKSNLLLLLTTDIGERYYRSDYGINLRRYFFEPSDGMTYSEIEEEIRNAVKNYIPQLTITKVEIFTALDSDGITELDDNQINIDINFTYSDTAFGETDSIRITV